MEKVIVIVDDSRVTRMMIRSIVTEQHADWTVIEAENAENALSSLDGKHVDYFSVDFNMPGINGLELIDKLKPKYPNAKMALMTANIQDATKNRCSSMKIAIFFKPITEQNVGPMLSFFNE